MRTRPQVRDVLSQIKHIRDSTYGPLSHYPRCGSSVSDIFIGREGLFETRFHGENTLALVLGNRVPVEHVIARMGTDGNLIDVLKYSSDDYRMSFDLPSIGHEVYSFIHLTNYDEEMLLRVAGDERLVARLHRGYTGYRMRGSPMETVVHGNFGLVYLNRKGRLESLARQKSVHRYTVQEVFNETFRYELCFPNPTARPLRIDVDFIQTTGEKEKTIRGTVAPFGSWLLQVDSDQLQGGRYLSWCSRLPVGRCIIFEIDDLNSTCNVFHS